MKKLLVLIMIVVLHTLSAEMMDYAVDNSDNCSKDSTKSESVCENVSSYRKDDELKRYKDMRLVRQNLNYNCKDNSWVTFSKGWDDGYLSAQGRWKRLLNGCPEYYRGWYEGYNHCKCQEIGECVTVTAVY